MIGDLARLARQAVTARVDAGSLHNARAEIAHVRARSERRTAPWLAVCPSPPGAGDPPQQGTGS